jgi:mRNA-degrading endonuclease RelE of RelBE toxin-antitoxin system
MNYKTEIDKEFGKEFKILLKKFPSLKKDFQNILDNVEKELALADDLGNGFRKIRINIKSKGRGSSGGGRIITYETIVAVDNKLVIFASIYNKGDYNSIDLYVLKKNLDLSNPDLGTH